MFLTSAAQHLLYLCTDLDKDNVECCLQHFFLLSKPQKEAIV